MRPPQGQCCDVQSSIIAVPERWSTYTRWPLLVECVSNRFYRSKTRPLRSQVLPQMSGPPRAPTPMKSPQPRLLERDLLQDFELFEGFARTDDRPRDRFF